MDISPCKAHCVRKIVTVREPEFHRNGPLPSVPRPRPAETRSMGDGRGLVLRSLVFGLVLLAAWQLWQLQQLQQQQQHAASTQTEDHSLWPAGLWGW